MLHNKGISQSQDGRIKRDKKSPMKKLPTKLIQRYWRFSRGLTLGAQGVIMDEDNRVLLVRHAYRPGWHFPGGGVEWNEPLHTALERELFEEAGVILKSTPQLHGIFTNFEAFPGDHIALFIVNDWEQITVPKPNNEIAEQGFFSFDALPEDISEGTKNRLGELFERQPVSSKWVQND